MKSPHEHFIDESIVAPTGVPIERESPFYPTSAPGIVVEEITMEEWEAARMELWNKLSNDI